jgi:hypothetical protein
VRSEPSEQFCSPRCSTVLRTLVLWSLVEIFDRLGVDDLVQVDALACQSGADLLELLLEHFIGDDGDHFAGGHVSPGELRPAVLDAKKGRQVGALRNMVGYGFAVSPMTTWPWSTLAWSS